MQTDIDLLSVSEVVDLPPAIGSRDGCIVGLLDVGKSLGRLLIGLLLIGSLLGSIVVGGSC